MAPVQPENWGHAEWPLGAHLTDDGATFAVYAPDASRVQLDFFPQALGAEPDGVDGLLEIVLELGHLRVGSVGTDRTHERQLGHVAGCVDR